MLFVANASSTHSVRWVNALAHRGLDVHLAHIADQEPGGDPIDERVTVHRLPFSGQAGYYFNAGALRLLGSRLRPDIVNGHYASGYGTLCRHSGLPYLLSVWGSDVYEFPFRSQRHLRVVQRNLKQAQGIASTSHCLAEQVRRVLGDPVLPVTVTPFGADLSVFDPSTVLPAEHSNRIVIGNVKPLADIYGLDVLVRAVGLLRQQIGDTEVELRIYGEGPQQPELERLIEGLDLKEMVRLLGPVTHDMMPSTLACLDVFCATSRYESFGVVAVEAMAMRRPVVVSDAEGLAEVVGDAGIVVPREDACATADALARVISDASLRTALGHAGRRRVTSAYDWEDNVDSVVALYARLSVRR